MDHPRLTSGTGEDNTGIPDDLRCKRSDGKQWRCTAMCMPDKTVCEKHYYQAKKRAANSALRATQKKGKKRHIDESEMYLESKRDDFDVPLAKASGLSLPVSGKKIKGSQYLIQHSPDTPSIRSSSLHATVQPSDDLLRDVAQFEENWRPSKTPPFSAAESLRTNPQRSFDTSNMVEYSYRDSDSTDDAGAQTCHQCRKTIRDRVIWCMKCDRRGYCGSCVSLWYSDIPVEELQNACPACRGTCNCRVCLRGDNIIKMRIREIPVLDKLRYLYYLLSSVLPVVKQIHREQCFEVELEKRIHGSEIDLARAKLNADEQMCCNFCRIPIIDYLRRCQNCSYDLCLGCCQDLRASAGDVKEEGNQTEVRSQEKGTGSELLGIHKQRLHISDRFPKWISNSDGSIPCPPKEYGGCGYSSLNLSRIFKMNWVAKLVKNVEEMVSGCEVNDPKSHEISEYKNPRLCQCAHREDGTDNFLYCPESEDIKSDGIGDFRRHWVRGEPVIVKEVCDRSLVSCWDPAVMWRRIREMISEKMEDDKTVVKAINCLNWSEIDIELGEFIKGYSEGRNREDGCPEMLKLKNWPSPSASEEFLLYQKPEFISRLPLLEHIHSKWGLLNVAAKLPHYSLQSDVGPKISISYGTYEELGRGDSVTNLHFNMRDMVYLLVHTSEVNLEGAERMGSEELEESSSDSDIKVSAARTDVEGMETEKSSCDSDFKVSAARMDVEGMETTNNVVEESSSDSDVKVSSARMDVEGMETEESLGDSEVKVSAVRMDVERIETTNNVVEEAATNDNTYINGEKSERTNPGAFWDVFRKQDVPKLTEYLQIHCDEFARPDYVMDNFVTHLLYNEAVFLTKHHKRKLKEEFGVEPWSFEQHLGQAVFIPAGCPFQVRNLQSNVQLGLDFLSPESLGEAVRMAEDIRCLPNDHEAKLQAVEVGKMSLYAASSAIKEVQKLVLDPKLDAELGFEDPNLTAMVSENLEKMNKQRQITCA